MNKLKLFFYILNISVIILIIRYIYYIITSISPSIPSIPSSSLNSSSSSSSSSISYYYYDNYNKLIEENNKNKEIIQELLRKNQLQNNFQNSQINHENNEIVERNFNEQIKKTKERFKNHPSHSLSKDLSLEDYMLFLAKRKECLLKPIFITMARVSSELYWQLIENYFYTMYSIIIFFLL